ncbi:MAG TPA: methyltransferase domain-containing protein [Dehalococcoidia bacterium]|nr:methyltransferase domain-containing protein [Dehalococcoidia bacterium]
MNDIPFTGERVVPGGVDETLWYEHMVRYLFAGAFAQGAAVLDAGCGAGYGADFLAAAGACRVIGIDNAQDAMTHAGRRYRQPNLAFVVMDGARLGFPDGVFDLAVSFEVIEHLADQEGYLGELARVLKPQGLLLLSTPNRQVYRLGQEPNPFHTHEFDLEELQATLARFFPQTEVLSQDYLAGIALTPLPDRAAVPDTLSVERTLIKDAPSHLYFLALCSHERRIDLRTARTFFPFSYDRDRYLGTLQAEFEDKLTWALRLRQELEGKTAELATVRQQKDAEIRALRDSLAVLEHRRADVERLAAEAARLQREAQEMRDASPWRRGLRALGLAALPVSVPYRLARHLFHLRRPRPASLRSGLLIGSAAVGNVVKIAHALTDQYPFLRLTVYARQGDDVELRQRLPGLEVRTLNPAHYRRRPLSLLAALWRERFDLAVVPLTGEKGYTRSKLVGFLSGARYVLVFNENVDSFFWMLRHTRFIAAHLLWRIRSGRISLAVSPPTAVLVPVGYAIVFVRAAPLLLRAFRNRRRQFD